MVKTETKAKGTFGISIPGDTQTLTEWDLSNWAEVDLILIIEVDLVEVL